MDPDLYMLEYLTRQRAWLAEAERERLVALLPPRPPRKRRLRAALRRVAAELGRLRLGSRPVRAPHPTAHSTTTFEPFP